VQHIPGRNHACQHHRITGRGSIHDPAREDPQSIPATDRKPGAGRRGPTAANTLFLCAERDANTERAPALALPSMPLYPENLLWKSSRHHASAPNDFTAIREANCASFISDFQV
jgi:hypothetical protein